MLTPFENFLVLSVQLCGISSYDLVGTGYARRYFATVESIVGRYTFYRLLDSFADIARKGGDVNEALRVQILGNSELGPVARNIIKLWYLAMWFRLPDEWYAKYGAEGVVETFVPFAYAYPESLLGPATGAHPAGAKPTGHQSWTLPPRFLPIPDDCV
jgi:hypothetical protein